MMQCYRQQNKMVSLVIHEETKLAYVAINCLHSMTAKKFQYHRKITACGFLRNNLGPVTYSLGSRVFKLTPPHAPIVFLDIVQWLCHWIDTRGLWFKSHSKDFLMSWMFLFQYRLTGEKLYFFVQFSFLNTCVLFMCFFVKVRHELAEFTVIFIQEMLMVVDLSQSN